MSSTLLTSFYHQNPVSSCLATLDAYSPKRVVKIVSDGSLETNPQPLGDKFKAAMTSSMKDRNKHDLDPALRRLRDQLNKLRAVQAAN